MPSKPSLTSHKTCQGVQNRSISASQSFSVLRHKEYSCKGPFFPCDGASLHLVELLPGEIWGCLHIQVPTKILSPDLSCTHTQQLSQGWRISLLHLGLQGVSYSFRGPKSRAEILLFQNAFCLLNHVSVGCWEPLTSLSSKFFPEESLYLDWLVHYHTKITSLLRIGRAWLKTKTQRKLVLFRQEIMEIQQSEVTQTLLHTWDRKGTVRSCNVMLPGNCWGWNNSWTNDPGNQRVRAASLSEPFLKDLNAKQA